MFFQICYFICVFSVFSVFHLAVITGDSHTSGRALKIVLKESLLFIPLFISSDYLSIYSSVYPCVYSSVYSSVYHCVYPCVYSSVYPSVLVQQSCFPFCLSHYLNHKPPTVSSYSPRNSELHHWRSHGQQQRPPRG